MNKAQIKAFIARGQFFLFVMPAHEWPDWIELHRN